ncbi:MAG: hypothetical protein LAQ30_07800 [Acidobacteriia bacterium]|nr:hypothetical protein [Terriglobia bacterium]
MKRDVVRQGQGSFLFGEQPGAAGRRLNQQKDAVSASEVLLEQVDVIFF